MLVKTLKDLGREPLPPKPRVRDELFKRLDGMPAALRADIEGMLAEARKEIAAAGTKNATEASALLERVTARLSDSVQARLAESMAEIVEGLSVLRAELAALRAAPKKETTWHAEVQGRDGKTMKITFTPDKGSS